MVLMTRHSFGEWVLWPTEAAVPEGAYVRVDMSTGERWIERNSTSLEAPSDSLEARSSMGLAVSRPEELEATYRSSVERATRADDPGFSATGEKLPDASREEKIMTSLRKLPLHEQERLASKLGRAKLEQLSNDELSLLWAQRQEELAEAIENIAKASEILTQRIESLNDFIEGRVEEVVAVAELEELDYELGNLDDAQDFHKSLDGMPLLIKLIEPTFSIAVRCAAATALGTAVKNDDDLQRRAAVAMPLLLEALDRPDLELRRKALYAIGATLRNNHDNTRSFARAGGFQVVTRALDAALKMLPAAWPVADKATTLLGDLAEAVQEYDREVVCQAVHDTLLYDAPPARLERFLHTLGALAPYCTCTGSPYPCLSSLSQVSGRQQDSLYALIQLAKNTRVAHAVAVSIHLIVSFSSNLVG